MQVAAEEDIPPPEPVPPTTWLGAVFLDRAGVDPQVLRRGTTCVITGQDALINPVAEAIRTAIQDCVGGRHTKPGPGILVVGEDGVVLPGWYAAALRRGAPIVAVTADGRNMTPREAVTLADRTITIPMVPRGDVIASVVEAATGNKIRVKDEDAALLGWDDLILVVQPDGDHIDAGNRIRKLARDRAEGPSKAKDRRPGATPGAKPPAADGVVRRLSEMTGFGDAGHWGASLAADLRDYRAGSLPWSDVDRGILLSGPPGCGKTTFAKALALECEVDLVPTTYTDWSAAGGSAGDTMSRGMTKLFDQWRAKAKSGPFILFIDEVDTMGRRGENGHNESWFTAVINGWLAFLDGAAPRDGIVVVAATNHPERVDPALCRAGRLDRHVVLPAPDIGALSGVLRLHLGPEAGLDGLDAAARLCRGMSPAEISLLVRDARRTARRVFGRAVCADDVCAALRSRRQATGLDPAEDRVIAVHEAGHALVMLRSGVARLEEVDLDRRYARSTRSTVATLATVEGRLDILVAGLVAEQVLLGSHSAGCEQDLSDATALSMSALGRWGMGARGLRALDASHMLDDAWLSATIDEMLSASHRRVTALVAAHRGSVERLAEALIERRYLDADEVRVVVEGETLAPACGDRR